MRHLIKDIPSPYSHSEREAARLKSYTGKAVLVFILYWFLFIPGLIANQLFYNEGRHMEDIAGKPLPGVAALAFMRKWLFILMLVILAILIVLFLVPLLRG